LSEEEQIRKLKEVAIYSSLVNVRKAAIDALAAYGERAIPAITEVVEYSVTEEVRVYGLQTIKKIKEGAKKV
jgi:HEAT repeat protein